jgi:hypothetical protein
MNPSEAFETSILTFALAVALGKPVATSMAHGNGCIQTKHTMAIGLAIGALVRALRGSGEVPRDVDEVLLHAFRQGLESHQLARMIQAELAKYGDVKAPD